MDQDKKALPQKRRKVAVDVKDIKKADGQVPTDVTKEYVIQGSVSPFFPWQRFHIRSRDRFSVCIQRK